MSARLDLFPTPVLKAKWSAAGQQNPALLQVINQQRQQSGGILRSNIGGWHSDTDMAVWGGPAAIALAEYATEVAGAHMTDIHPQGKRTFSWSVEMWASINPPGAANQQHCHPGALWSAVYYVDPGGSEAENGGGELVLEDPRFPTSHMTVPDLVMKMPDGAPMQSQVVIRPEAGMLVVFPSWLRHSVNQHRGANPRISVSLNLMVSLALEEDPATR